MGAMEERACGGTKVLVLNRRIERHCGNGVCVVDLGASIPNSPLDMCHLECGVTVGGAIDQQQFGVMQPAFPALWRLRQEDHKFKVSLVYRSCFQN